MLDELEGPGALGAMCSGDQLDVSNGFGRQGSFVLDELAQGAKRCHFQFPKGFRGPKSLLFCLLSLTFRRAFTFIGLGEAESMVCAIENSMFLTFEKELEINRFWDATFEPQSLNKEHLLLVFVICCIFFKGDLQDLMVHASF